MLAHGGFQVLQTLLRLVACGSIWLRFWRKTTGAFASGCVWLRLSAGLCAQECAQALRPTAHSFPTFAFNSSNRFSINTKPDAVPSTILVSIMMNRLSSKALAYNDDGPSAGGRILLIEKPAAEEWDYAKHSEVVA